MSDTTPGVMFRQAKRGYDPDEVHARIDELTRQLSEARNRGEAERRRAEESEQHVEALRAQVRDLEGRSAQPRYDSVAQRVRAILEAADEAAAELKARTEADAEDQRRQGEERVAEMLREARVEADAMVGRARRVADEAVADSERKVEGLSAELAALVQQRDTVLNALGSLGDRLAQATQDLVASSHGGEQPRPSAAVVPLVPQARADDAVLRDEAGRDDDSYEQALAATQ